MGVLVCLACVVAPIAGLSLEVLPRLPPYPLGPIVMLSGGGILAGQLESMSSEHVVLAAWCLQFRTRTCYGSLSR